VVHHIIMRHGVNRQAVVGVVINMHGVFGRGGDLVTRIVWGSDQYCIADRASILFVRPELAMVTGEFCAFA
jgi:hypothetical protein